MVHLRPRECSSWAKPQSVGTLQRRTCPAFNTWAREAMAIHDTDVTARLRPEEACFVNIKGDRIAEASSQLPGATAIA